MAGCRCMRLATVSAPQEFRQHYLAIRKHMMLGVYTVESEGPIRGVARQRPRSIPREGATLIRTKPAGPSSMQIQGVR